MVQWDKQQGPFAKLGSWRSRALAGVATACVAAVVAVWLWVPSTLLARVQSRAALRGLIVDVDDVAMGLSSVTLEGVRVRGARGTALDVRVKTAAVGVSPWRLLWGARSSAVRYVELAGLSITIDIADAGFEDTRLALDGDRGSDKGKDGASADRKAAQLPEVRLSSGQLVVRDGEGPLLRLGDIEGHSGKGEWSVSAKRAVVGCQPGEVVSLDAVQLSGSLHGRRPQVATAEVGGGVLHWVSDESEPSARGRTPDRLGKLKSALWTRSEPADAVPAPVGARTTVPPLLADDLRVKLTGLEVLSTAPNRRSLRVLSELTVLVEGAGQGSFRARGGGTSGGEGRLSWDLQLAPLAARVEGNVELEALPLSLVAPLLPPIPWSGLDRSRVDGRLTLKGEGLERVAASGELRVADVSIAAQGIGPVPVGPIGLKLKGQGAWIPAQRRLELKNARVESAGASLLLQGVVEWARDHYLFDLQATLPETQCADVLAAVPQGLLDELSEVRFGGKIQGKSRVWVDSRNLDETVVDFDIDDDCSFLAVPGFLSPERFQRPFLHRAQEPDGQAFEMETGPGTPAWTAIERISPFMVQAVLAHEDGSFFAHKGFAEAQIARALGRNLKAGRYRYGASTITMQLVKNVYLHREKMLARKVQEAFITWWLEQRWTKKEILELYLNVIEYGPSVYGVRQAAWYYFGVTPLALSPGQASFLAMILPNPKRFHERIQAGGLSARMRQRLERFLKHMHARGRIDAEALSFGIDELSDFGFYQEGGAPQQKEVKGAAKPPPFDASDPGFDAWDLDPSELDFFP